MPIKIKKRADNIMIVDNFEIMLDLAKIQLKLISIKPKKCKFCNDLMMVQESWKITNIIHNLSKSHNKKMARI